MSEETKGTTATVQTESTEPESQTEPAQRAETERDSYKKQLQALQKQV